MNQNMICKKCAAPFSIPSDDLVFLDKVSPIINGVKYPLSTPTFCPDCRQIRRQSHINEIHLYRRKCDKTGKDMLSNVHPSSPCIVYNQEYWWSDEWDATAYGQDYDFSKPFFQQYHELFLKVPRPSLYTAYRYDENCDYTNYAGRNKNCYLLFDADYCRDTYYSYSLYKTTNCLDSYRTRECELTYEAIDSKNCYNCSFVTNSSLCNDSAFLDNCEGCKNCFMSFNQQHKEYFIYNRQGTKEEYEALMAQLSSATHLERLKQEFSDNKKLFAKKYMHGAQNENVSGDYISNCNNVLESYDCNNVNGGKYLYQNFGVQAKDCYDCDEVGEATELMYETSNSGYNSNRVIGGVNILDQNNDIIYANHCHYSSNLFGCVGLKRKKYCILNKQYTKEEYEELVPKIIEHMISTGEWGEHFPSSISPYCYNETLAMDFYPLTKEEALAQGYSWRDDDKKRVPQIYTIPDAINEVPDTIINEMLACTDCNSNYKIIPQELEFYRAKQIAIPKKCFKCRHYDRLSQRNSRKLWDRNCTHCNTPLRSSYSPERPEPVYCETCYLGAVY